MFGLILGVCLNGPMSCDWSVLDSFDTYEQCEVVRKDFTIENKTPEMRKAILVCDELKD